MTVPSTRDETLAGSDGDYTAMDWHATTGSQPFNQGATPQTVDGMLSRHMLAQPLECEPPIHGTSLILLNNLTPISPNTSHRTK